MQISECMIELTRRCNMFCEHCLRGEPENIDMPKEHITSFLEQTHQIGTMVLTGGEPTLAAGVLRFILDEMKRLGNTVDNFYMATNGKYVSDEFILLLMEFYLFVDDAEPSEFITSVEISNDMFHEDYDGGKLKALSFFRKKYDSKHDERKGYLNQGRYKENWGDGEEPSVGKIEWEDSYILGEVYLNVKGEIIEGCNWSYENQSEHKICDVKDLTKIASELIKKEEQYESNSAV